MTSSARLTGRRTRPASCRLLGAAGRLRGRRAALVARRARSRRGGDLQRGRRDRRPQPGAGRGRPGRGAAHPRAAASRPPGAGGRCWRLTGLGHGRRRGAAAAPERRGGAHAVPAGQPGRPVRARRHRLAVGLRPRRVPWSGAVLLACAAAVAAAAAALVRAPATGSTAVDRRQTAGPATTWTTIRTGSGQDPTPAGPDGDRPTPGTTPMCATRRRTATQWSAESRSERPGRNEDQHGRAPSRSIYERQSSYQARSPATSTCTTAAPWPPGPAPPSRWWRSSSAGSRW